MGDFLELSTRLERLSKEESDAYLRYASKEHSYPLSPQTEASMYILFLQGYSTKEISEINPGIEHGAIVKARVESNWDIKKSDYINDLIETMQPTVQKTQLEAVRFVTDAMSAFQKLYGDKFRLFLQTGDPEDLGEAAKGLNFKNYKEMLDSLLKLTGQDKQKNITGGFTVTHKVEGRKEKVINLEEPTSSKEAEEFLKKLTEE